MKLTKYEYFERGIVDAEGKFTPLFKTTDLAWDGDALQDDEREFLTTLLGMIYAQVDGITRRSTPSRAWDELVIEHEGGKLRIPIKDNQFEALENKRFYKLHELGLEQ